MKRLALAIILTATVVALASSPIILSSLSSLYYTRNPIDNLFRTSWIELEAFYRPLEESQSYQNVSLTFRLPFNYFTAAITASYGGENLLDEVQNNEIDWESEVKNVKLFANVAAQLSAFVVAITTPPFNVDFEDSSVRLIDRTVKIALGLGNVKLDADYKSYVSKLVKKGGAALYYIKDDLLYIDSTGATPNTDVDWLNAKAGLLADAVGYDGRVVLDLGLNLQGIKILQSNEVDEEISTEEILKYLYATLEIEGDPLIIGATYDNSGFLLSGGLSLFGALKSWVEVVFDHEFNMQGIGAFAQLHF